MSDNLPDKTLAPELAVHGLDPRTAYAMQGLVRPSMRVMMDPTYFNHVQSIAKMMSVAEGVVPKHLIGKPAACFAVLVNAIDWGLNPFQVAMATYETRSGKIGYQAVLVHAIMQASGQLERPIEATYIGDWSPIIGNYTVRERNENGRIVRSAEPLWTDETAKSCGAGIVLSTVVRKTPVEFKFHLYQAWPRHSVLWATDPKTQLFYAALRRFATANLSSAMMGIVIDEDDEGVLPLALAQETVDTEREEHGAASKAPQPAVVAMAARRQAERRQKDAANAAPQNDAQKPVRIIEGEVQDNVPTRDGGDDTAPPAGAIYLRMPGERAVRALETVEQAIEFIEIARRKNAANPNWAEAVRSLNERVFQKHPVLTRALGGQLALNVE